MITSILYVSGSRLPASNQDEEIDKIISVARSRNAQLGVTGALLFTEARFAQVLEGSADAVDELLKSIREDPRHKDLNVIQVEELETRRFPGWSMAYSGSSFYVDRHVKPLLNSGLGPGTRAELAGKLIGFLMELVRQKPYHTTGSLH